MNFQEQKYEIIEEEKWHYRFHKFLVRNKVAIISFKLAMLLIFFILFLVGVLTMQQI